MARLTLEIATELRAQGFDDAADRLEKMHAQLQKTNEDASAGKQAFSDFKNEVLGFASVVGVIEFFKGMADAASQAEEAMGLLGSKVESSGTNFEKYRPQVEAFTTALAEQSRFSKTEYLTALGNAIDKVHDLGVAEQLIVPAAGLATAKHMDLATAMDMVAGVEEGQQRATLQLVRIMGLHKSAAQDSEAVLKILQDRYGALATQQTSFAVQQKELSNQWEMQKETLGGAFLPLINLTSKALLTLFDVLVGLGKELVDIPLALINLEVALFRFVKAAITAPLQIRQSWSAFMGEFKGMGQDFTKDFKDTADQIAKVWGNNGPIPKALKPLKTTFSETFAEIEELAQQFYAQAEALTQVSEGKRLAQLQIHHKKEEEQLVKHLRQLYGKHVDLTNLLKALHAKQNAETLAAEAALWKKRLSFVEVGMVSASKAITKALTGDKEAFKTAAKEVIQTTAERAETNVIANSIEGASLQVAQGNYAAAAGTLAWGMGEAAAIAALAGVAANVLGTTTPVSQEPTPVRQASSASQAASTSSGNQAVAGGRSNGPNQVILHVQGDFLGDPQVVDALAKRISSAVEDRGVRLVASKTA